MSRDAAVLGVERSMGGRRWEARLADQRLGLALAQRLDLPEIVGRVLAGRGVGLDTADDFLTPSLRTALPDPSHLRDMDRAVDRLAAAIAAREPIAVFGDYDVDGATSTALVSRFLRALGVPVVVYVPDRMTEGYGPNEAAMAMLAGRGIRVVITVDCGTTAFAALDAARRLNLDVVVVDHHIGEPELPAAHAVVNPNRFDETSTHGQMAAVGVAFLLLVGLNRALRDGGVYDRLGVAPPDLMGLLDLVALGTVCDVVPLTGVNRAFVSQGIKVLGRRRNVGLARLADVAKLDETPEAYHLGYVLGPRINAGGRVGRADLGARLLGSDDADESTGMAMELDRLNTERREIEAAVEAEALELAERQADAPFILVAHQGWHPGVIGIVAGRLKERFHRPVFVVAADGAVGKGSGRSVPGVDLGSAVTAARQAGLLVNGGGHAMAAGLTVPLDRLVELHGFLAERIVAQTGGEPPAPRLGLDGVLAVGGATSALVDVLERIGPFGTGNAQPRFALSAVRILKADVVGQGHIRVIMGADDGSRLKGIAFRAADGPVGATLLQARGLPLHVAGGLRRDRWQGRDDVQMFIDDVASAAAGH
ncbi:single-stranded-DNA-specific exonuclease RecJ [Tistrella bauzanensis]|uniref:Single-stranded-DNA-specific exonuclease RecJ n=1 Tax=Tistrella bauzanensis TaxID=657419 RepID=A0ABQ1I9F2_9PROT|nr:single-stranded-DNA-specific exonuclease RecJ [Tistrella bauzanensis]GGB26607.1 single-stranded-DNA-specific exonuclease RecJ [Tistrella bauzanensis]